MTQTALLSGLFAAFLREHGARTGRSALTERITVEVCYQQKLFIAEPCGLGRVKIRFGRQSFGHPSLSDYLEEALRAAEALAYGLSTASAIRLDAEQRAEYEWLLAQRDVPTGAPCHSCIGSD